MMVVWGWLFRKSVFAGLVFEIMLFEFGVTEDCMGFVVRGSLIGCCFWEVRKRRECSNFIFKGKYGGRGMG